MQSFLLHRRIEVNLVGSVFQHHRGHAANRAGALAALNDMRVHRTDADRSPAVVLADTNKKRGEAPLQRCQETVMRVRAVPITAPVRQCRYWTLTVQVPRLVGLMMQS